MKSLCFRKFIRYLTKINPIFIIFNNINDLVKLNHNLIIFTGASSNEFATGLR